MGQFNEARLHRFNLHRDLENFFKNKSSSSLTISQQKLHSLISPPAETPKVEENSAKAQKTVQKNVHRRQTIDRRNTMFALMSSMESTSNNSLLT